MTRRAALGAAVALLVAGIAADAQLVRPRPGGQRAGFAMANPSAVVAAELGFARLAREKGQWTAFRETADKDAVMFVPDVVNAQRWLKKRPDPAQALVWEPYRVFVSCDGSYAFSTGPRTGPGGSAGTFNTIWRRQQKGDWKWVVDFGSDEVQPKQQEVIVEGKVAQCAGRPRPSGDGAPEGWPDEAGERGKLKLPPVVQIADPPPPSGEGQSPDGTLRWRWSRTESARGFVVTMHDKDGERTLVELSQPVTTP